MGRFRQSLPLACLSIVTTALVMWLPIATLAGEHKIDVSMPTDHGLLGELTLLKEEESIRTTLRAVRAGQS